MTRQEIEQAITDHLGMIRPVVLKTMKKYTAHRCAADIDDIASATVLCLLDGRLDNYEHTTEKALKQWIGYITMQRTIDYLRALKKNTPLLHDSDEDAPPRLAKEVMKLSQQGPLPDQILLDAEFQLERRARLRAAVASLEVIDQRTFAAITSEGYTTSAYAAAEGIKVASVHTRRHRMINNLRKCI